MDNQLQPNQCSDEKSFMIKEPNMKYRSQVENLENIMLRLVGLIPNVDMIYEDIPIEHNGKLFIHTLRSKVISPNKTNFIFLHGYLGSSNNFIRLCPYLLPKYNIFIPDTIGMALSARPQVNFKSTEHCTDFFIDIIEKWRIALNITNFYIAGHSLGGYFTGSYILKYPNEVKKVLLLSPAGISDTMKYKGNIHKEAGCGMGFGLSLMLPAWLCKPRFQQMYTNCLFTPLMKLVFRVRYDVSAELNEIMAQLSELAMRYPNDLDHCLFYVFKQPFPQGNKPLEDRLINESKLSFVICFGGSDWMDRVGSYRLETKDNDRFKVFSVSKFGHMFMLESPKDLYDIIQKHFE